MKIRCLVILMLLLDTLLSGFVVPPVAHASTITVNTLIDESDSSCADGNCSLRDAVAAAQPGDSINFSVSGTIVLTHGEISVYKDNLMIKGPGPDRLAISGNNTSRVFVVALADVTISDLSIINGFSTSRGGGIYGYLAGSLTLVNCNVSGNRAEFGGGIYSEAIGLEIRGCSIRDNHAALGGGVDNSSGLQVSGSVFSNNTATSSGGGIYLWEGAASIVDSAFTGNEAAVDGGGIYSPLSQLEVVNTTFSMNSAGGFGGGISASGDIYSNGYLTVTNSVFSENSALFGGGIDVLRLKNASAINSTFSRNTASSGGGVYNRGKLSVTGSSFLGNEASFSGGGIENSSYSQLDITRSSLSANSASWGGGMYNDGPTLFATNCTLVDNSAYDGGSLYNSDGALVLTNSTLSNNSGGIRNDDTATVRNTIIANSTRENCRGKPLSTDSVNNLSTDNTCSVGFTQVTAASLVLGALIGNPAYIPLNPGSVAVDAGTNHGCPSTDQRGWLRPYDGDGDGIPICDVGSFELVMLTHNLYLPITLK